MAKLLHKAALQGYTEAQTRLGLAYCLGEGVHQSSEEGMDWLTKAAGKGDVIAQFYLGLIYRDGMGVPESLETAVGWFKLSAKQGNTQAQDYLEKTEKIIQLQERRSQLRKETLQTSDLEEKKQIWTEIRKIERECDKLRGKEPKEEPEDNSQNNSSDSKGSGSGCMLLFVLMLSPIVAAGCYCVCSLLS